MSEPLPDLRRLRLDLAYCGTPWRGWQGQGDGTGVQDQLYAALRRLTRIFGLEVEGASRTDAGVHALGQVAHVDVPSSLRLSAKSIRNGLNGLLPGTIRVLGVAEAAAGFHASLSAVGKIYRYRIWRLPDLDPFAADRVWHVPGPLDLAALRQAADGLRGRHNFVRLSANPGAVPEAQRRLDVAGHTRTLRRVELRELGDVLEIELEGDAFLYHMVRLMVGALLQVARGRASHGWLSGLLASPDGPQNQVMAPAGGLYLVQVMYPEPLGPESVIPVVPPRLPAANGR